MALYSFLCEQLGSHYFIVDLSLLCVISDITKRILQAASHNFQSSTLDNDLVMYWQQTYNLFVVLL